MADKVKTTKDLKLVALFDDGDDRTLSWSLPKSTVNAAAVKGTAAAAGKVLVGDKTGAAFSYWKRAYIAEQTIVYLDLS